MFVVHIHSLEPEPDISGAWGAGAVPCLEDVSAVGDQGLQDTGARLGDPCAGLWLNGDLVESGVLGFWEVLGLERDPTELGESVFGPLGSRVFWTDTENVFEAIAHSETGDARGVDGEAVFVFRFLEIGVSVECGECGMCGRAGAGGGSGGGVAGEHGAVVSDAYAQTVAARRTAAVVAVVLTRHCFMQRTF